MVKKIMAIIMSIMMLVATVQLDSVQIKAVEQAENKCQHIMTKEAFDKLSDEFWKTHSKSDYEPNGENSALVGVELPASCTEEGWKLPKKGMKSGLCLICGEKVGFEEYKEVVPATGHHMKGTEPTCTEKGVKTCINKHYALDTVKENGLYKAYVRITDCNFSETMPALGHLMDEGRVIVSPTCLEAGKTEYKCTREDCDYTEVKKQPKALGHDYKKEITREATCTEDGVMTYICQREGCDSTYTETIPSKGHDWEVQTIKEENCTEDGQYLYTCRVCGETKTVKKDALGHNYVSEITKEATCTEDGIKMSTCRRCGDVRTEVIPMIGHSYTSEITKQATCTEEGVKTFTCKNCGNTYTEALPMIGHDYASKITKEATCIEEGINTFICKNCGDTYTEAIPAKGHNFQIQEGQSIYPTCTEAGRNVVICDQCGASYIEYVAPLGHEIPMDDTTKIENANCIHGNIYKGQCIHENYVYEADEDGNRVLIVDEDGNPVKVRCTEEVYSDDEKIDDSVEFVDGVRIFSFEKSPVGVDTFYITTDNKAIKTVIQKCAENVGLIIEEMGESTLVDRFIAHTGHQYRIKDAKSATCEMDAYIVLECEREDYTYEGDGLGEWASCPLNKNINNHEVKIVFKDTAIGHHWALLDDGSNKAPTCTEEGVRHYMCLNDHSHTYTEKIPAIGHRYTFVESYAATCTEGGYNLYKCDVCGAEYKEYITAKIPHNYVVTQKVAATCVKEGYEVYTCTECDNTYNKTTTPALGHDYKITSSTAATCVSEGFDTYTCTRCDETYNKVTTPAKVHQFTETNYFAPTCTKQGVRTYTCVNCEMSYNSYEAALGHNYGKVNVIEPTCTEKGYTIYTCTNLGCTESYKTDETDKVNHVLSVIDQKAATCAEDGYVTRACANCDYEETKVLEATGNHYYNNEVTKAATCIEDGVMTYTCKECGKTYTEVIPAIGHNYGDVKKVESTCTEGGYTIYTCTNPGCTESYKTDETDKVNHVLSVIDQKAATCTEKGYVTKKCENCEYTETEELSATGHIFDTEGVNTPVTCVKEGYTTYTCAVCNEKSVVKTAEKLGHLYKTVLSKKATIGKDGYTSEVCIHCGQTLYDTSINAIKTVKLAKTACVYNGKKLQPAVIIKDSRGKSISTKYYTVQYQNNKKIGMAKAIITFTGNYSGTITKTFTINPEKMNIGKVSTTKKMINFTWGKVNKCDGYVLQYSTKSSFKNAKKVKIKNKKAVEYQLTGLKSGKTYYIRIKAYKKVGKKTYSGNWATTKKVCK